MATGAAASNSTSRMPSVQDDCARPLTGAEAEAAAVAGAAAARPDALEQAQLAAVGAHE